MLVVDASACVSFLLGDDDADWVRERFRSESVLHAPALIDFEVASALRSLSDRRRFVAATEDLRAMRLVRYPGEPLLPRMWELRGHLTAYDAAYVALAEVLDAPLVTLDRRLARSGGHAAAIEIP
jgi:predicted nucleic acid-binding protein